MLRCRHDENKMNLLQADVREADSEVEDTLSVILHFQKILSPPLDLSVETLRCLKEKVKLPAVHDDEYLSSTDEEDDDFHIVAKGAHVKQRSSELHDMKYGS